MFRVTKRYEFDAAHRLLLHKGKCHNLHGHRYAVEVTWELDNNRHPGQDGMVVDFGHLPKEFGKWLDDTLDHATICNPDDAMLIALLEKEGWAKAVMPVHAKEPTAENMALVICLRAEEMSIACGSDAMPIKVQVWETPTSCATYEAP